MNVVNGSDTKLKNPDHDIGQPNPSLGARIDAPPPLSLSISFP